MLEFILYICTMFVNESLSRIEIVDLGRIMYDKGWVAANDGNISVRLGEDRFLATPTGVSKGSMKPDDLIIVNSNGEKVAGNRAPTSEIAMHMAIYACRPDVHAVVHAHPPTATGFAAAGRALNAAVLPEVIMNLGSVPLAEYGLPGTPELLRAMRHLIRDYEAILMANHGVVTYGGDLLRASFHMETVEHTARIMLIADMLGGAQVLSRTDVDKLIASRSRYGVAPPGSDCSRPLTREDYANTRETRVIQTTVGRVRLRRLVAQELISRLDNVLSAAKIRLAG